MENQNSAAADVLHQNGVLFKVKAVIACCNYAAFFKTVAFGYPWGKLEVIYSLKVLPLMLQHKILIMQALGPLFAPW